MFDLPENTNVTLGLAIKPYPRFRLPGHCRYSIAYHSKSDKAYNYPFTATPLAPSLKEGDVGDGYRPRNGTFLFSHATVVNLRMRLLASTDTTSFLPFAPMVPVACMPISGNVALFHRGQCGEVGFGPKLRHSSTPTGLRQ